MVWPRAGCDKLFNEYFKSESALVIQRKSGFSLPSSLQGGLEDEEGGLQRNSCLWWVLRMGSFSLPLSFFLFLNSLLPRASFFGSTGLDCGAEESCAVPLLRHVGRSKFSPSSRETGSAPWSSPVHGYFHNRPAVCSPS